MFMKNFCELEIIFISLIDVIIICMKLVERLLVVVKSDCLKLLLMLLDKMRSWLGSGVFIKISIVVIYIN